MSTNSRQAPEGYKWVYAERVKHYKTGKYIYPKSGKSFCFLVKDS